LRHPINMTKCDMVEHQNIVPVPSETPSGKPGDIALTEELQTAIAHAYGVFAPYGARFTAQVCRCPVCFAEADRDRLLKLPPRQIDGYLLDQYSWSAHGHDNDGPLSDDLRYLLPRYFEMFALNDPALHNAPACNLTQLGRTAYRATWPRAEVAAIDGYFDTLLAACLANDAVEGGWKAASGSRYRCALRLNDVLGMLVRAGADVARLLAIWEAAPDPAAALHIANQRFMLVTDSRGTRLYNEQLEPDFVDAVLAIGAFVTSAKATSRIEAAFFQATDPAAQSLLSDALFLS
jgi:hypothetical protein